MTKIVRGMANPELTGWPYNPNEYDHEELDILVVVDAAEYLRNPPVDIPMKAQLDQMLDQIVEVHCGSLGMIIGKLWCNPEFPNIYTVSVTPRDGTWATVTFYPRDVHRISSAQDITMIEVRR